LSELAIKSNLPLKCSSQDLVEIARQITSALQRTAVSAVTPAPRPAGEERDWCEVIAKKARDLAVSLGVREDTPAGGWAFFSMMETLESGIQIKEGNQDFHKLLTVAAPSNTPQEYWNAVVNLLDRMVPSLRALALLADAAGSHWSDQSKPKGSVGDISRLYLMDELSNSFEAMFGRRPAPSVRPVGRFGRELMPGGLAIGWFREFFLAVNALLPNTPQDEGQAILRRIAEDALNSPKNDVLAGWFKNVRQRRKKAND
jgi:hypothetical protein